MTLICGIDLETTGLNPATDRIIEVGAVVWDWERKRPVQIISDLVQCPVKIPPEATKVNNITDEDLALFGSVPATVYGDLSQMISSCKYVMGHNFLAFDKAFMDNEFKRQGMRQQEWPLIIDTLVDIPYTHLDTSRKLSHLAMAHQILNPFPHRAVFDVLTMLQMASKYPLEAILARANSPSKIIRAIISYDDRQLAKDNGFRWTNGSWVKTVKGDDNNYPFKTVVVS